MNKDYKIQWILEHPFYRPETVLGILCAEFFLGGFIIAKLFFN